MTLNYYSLLYTLGQPLQFRYGLGMTLQQNQPIYLLFLFVCLSLPLSLPPSLGGSCMRLVRRRYPDGRAHYVERGQITVSNALSHLYHGLLWQTRGITAYPKAS